MMTSAIVHRISAIFSLSVCGVDWDQASHEWQDVDCLDCIRIGRRS